VDGPPCGRNAAVVLGSAGVVVALPSKSVPSLQSGIGSVSASGGTEQCDGDEVLNRMGAAS
ncbi:hypothetical protein, partial [Mesorhizobium sp. M7A.F.Ca.US.002.01.1.1]|uniref:hypothetical protein n=1 Tax=Mesorhizobium sp. M7A.F.Ca.US.002.01.1.1 TaxID=2496700 RepID=UPI0019D459CE